MPVQIQPIGFDPIGDDQQWKRDQIRFNADVIAAITELQSQLANLQGRVK